MCLWLLLGKLGVYKAWTPQSSFSFRIWRNLGVNNTRGFSWLVPQRINFSPANIRLVGFLWNTVWFHIYLSVPRDGIPTVCVRFTCFLLWDMQTYAGTGKNEVINFSTTSALLLVEMGGAGLEKWAHCIKARPVKIRGETSLWVTRHLLLGSTTFLRRQIRITGLVTARSSWILCMLGK